MENNEPMPHFQIIFEFLRYWGLWLNWNIHFHLASWVEKICRKDKKEFFCGR